MYCLWVLTKISLKKKCILLLESKTLSQKRAHSYCKQKKYTAITSHLLFVGAFPLIEKKQRLFLQMKEDCTISPKSKRTVERRGTIRLLGTLRKKVFDNPSSHFNIKHIFLYFQCHF
jgi:hypothetical protein